VAGGLVAALRRSKMPVCSTTRGEIHDGLFFDGRRLSLSRLPDFRQISAGQDRQEAGCHSII
jgi:hypothetical protein